MKKSIVITLLLVLTAAISVSCKKDLGASEKVNENSILSLKTKYPEAYDINWKSKINYDIASFKLPALKSKLKALLRAEGSTDMEAWFTHKDGSWRMTKEKEIHFSQLPQAVKNAFGASKFKDWKIDEILCIHRDGGETLYVIEVEKGKHEMDLYYTKEGILIKEVADSDNHDYEDAIIKQGPSFIQDFLTKNYPTARILDIDKEDNLWEIEILEGHTKREILFSLEGKWLLTRTEDIKITEVPQNILSAFKNSKYGQSVIDDIDHYLTPQKEFYRFELERPEEVTIDISTQGEISIAKSEENESIHRGLPEEIKKFIEKKYAHARILDVKRKNGLLKVEFMHENNKKKAFFNGTNSWTLTGWKVARRDVPQIVITAAKGKYPQGEIEDSYYVQAPKGEYYAIAIETKLDEELVVCVSAKGEILEVKSEDDFLL